MAISNAEAPITHVMRNAVSGNRKPGGAFAILRLVAIHVSGPHTKNANSANMQASTRAAKRGRNEKRSATPQAICPTPVMYARLTRNGIRME